MKNFRKFLILSVIFLIAVSFQGCDLVADIFGAGVWVGIIISALVVILIVWIAYKIIKSLWK